MTQVKWLDKTPAFIARARKRVVRGAKAAGNRYEKEAQEYLLDKYPDSYVNSPWLRVRCGERWSYIQPDGFIMDLKAGHITLVEIKLKHTDRAWWQIRQMYQPALVYYFGEAFTFGATEVCKWYEPRRGFPERFFFAEDPHNPGREQFGVHIYRR